MLAWERRGLPPPPYRRFTVLAFLSLAVARVLLWFGWAPLQEPTRAWASTAYQGDVLEWLHRTPVDLCVTAFLLLAAVMLAVDPLRRLRLSMRHVRRQPTGPPARRLRFAGAQLLAGVAVAGLLGLLARLVQDTVSHTELDVLMLALLPPIEPRRLLVLLGLLAPDRVRVLGQRAGAARRPAALAPGGPRPVAARGVAAGAVDRPAGGGHRGRHGAGGDPPTLALLAMAVCVGAATLLSARGMACFRRGTQARRLLSAYAALLAPALLLYPLLLHAVDHARRT